MPTIIPWDAPDADGLYTHVLSPDLESGHWWPGDLEIDPATGNYIPE